MQALKFLIKLIKFINPIYVIYNYNSLGADLNGRQIIYTPF
jgi:hypothetical protein